MKDTPLNRRIIKDSSDLHGDLCPAHIGTDCANAMLKEGILYLKPVTGISAAMVGPTWPSFKKVEY